MTKKEKIRYDGAHPIGVLPYLIMLSITLMYTLCRQQMLICSLAMCFLTCGLYILIYHFRKSPAGAALITFIVLGFNAASMAVVGMSAFDFFGCANVKPPAALFEEGGFVHFVFTASSTFDPLNAAVAIILFSCVIGFTCCYFSAVLPRLCFLMLPSFIPLILSATAGGVLPLWMVILLYGTFVLAVFCSARKCESSDVLVFAEKTDLRTPLAALCAALVVISVAAVLPREKETPLKEMMDNFIIGRASFGRAGLGNFTASSSVNRGNNEPSDEILFTVMTDTPVLLDRWSFDIYNGEDGWSHHPDYGTGYPRWREYASQRRTSTLFRALREGAEAGLLDEYSDILTDLPNTARGSADMFIRQTDNAATKVIIHPVGVYEIELKGYDGSFYRTGKNEIFTEKNMLDAEYLMSFHNEPPCIEYIEAAGKTDFVAMLETAAEREVISDEMAAAFIDEYKNAQKYRRDTGTLGISTDIKRLAREITAGLSNDYEKAVALEKWFGEQGFVYDLEFNPESAQAEYFLFDSRRGICSDYATALTLLARAAGLTARYTEGFALMEDALDANGVYQVRAKHAHAYTQIYIAGCGWVNFDGTIYAESAESETNDLAVWIAAAAGAAVLLAIVLYIFRRPLSNVILAATYPVRSNRAKVRGVFLSARRLAADISGRSEAELSTGDVEKILTSSLYMPDEAASIRAAADELFYSGRNDTNADTKAIYKNLKALRREKRRLRR